MTQMTRIEILGEPMILGLDFIRVIRVICVIRG
jgi:hypothetical protein